MNLNAIEELILMMVPDEAGIHEQVKGMLEIVRKDPQRGLVQILGSAPGLGLDRSSWMYGVVTGVAMSAASVSPEMLKHFKR